MASKKMLILRGNSARKPAYPNEEGKKIPYRDGALHEGAAIEYATLRGFDPDVLDVSGDPLKSGDRDNNPQTVKAVARLKSSSYAAPAHFGIYGFSGGGYDVLHILKQLTAEQLQRLELVVVLGAPPVKDGSPSQSDFEAAAFARRNPGTSDIDWELVYRTNPNPGRDKKGWGGDKGGGGGYDEVVASKGVDLDDSHMFGPDLLLWQWKKEHPSQATAP